MAERRGHVMHQPHLMSRLLLLYLFFWLAVAPNVDPRLLLVTPGPKNVTTFTMPYVQSM